MATLQSMHDVFMHELRDLYSAERQLLKALPKMAKSAASPELADAFTTHLHETEGHKERLEQIFLSLGEKAGGVKCKGMEGLIDEGQDVLGMDGIATARDTAMIGAAQRVEHYEIAGYHSAISLAQAQGHTEAVSLLQANLREEEHADQLLTDIAQRTMKDGDGSTMGSEMPVATPRSARNGARNRNGATRKHKASRTKSRAR